MLRLRVQRGGHDTGTAGESADDTGSRATNRLDPYALNELDQRMLREAFRQARALQTHLDQSVGH